ncbi:MAG: DUF1684 domain-containing protein [Bacteroidetes bacterium]|nr:DUF1684 domain-containing protein [Bacteroidota bacterium]
MRIKILLLSLLVYTACWSQKQSGDSLKNSAIIFRQELDKQYADSLHSPLSQNDRKNFKGHEFFPYDAKLCVTAELKRTPAEKEFKMKTTTDREPLYVKYGEISFRINNKKYKLNVYQNMDLIKQVEYKDYLFLPFKDVTNGNETYGGGRYIDLRIPSGTKISVDFNKAYNPYCAYNHGYSCPVPPAENNLKTEIKAGIKFRE